MAIKCGRYDVIEIVYRDRSKRSFSVVFKIGHFLIRNIRISCGNRETGKGRVK